MIVACGQMVAHELADAESVWPVVERLAAGATMARADLLVLPECTYPAYWLVSRAHLEQQQLLDQQEVLSRFGNIARSGGFWLVVGFVEQTGGRLYNSAAVINRAGEVIGIARKSFLWDCDNRWFSPAEQLSVTDTEFGRVGVMICADGRAPEIAATLAAGGAEMIVMPTAWVNAAKGTGRFENPQADFLIRARAREFAVPFACADKSGREADAMEYVGQSQIVDASGNVTAIAAIEGEQLVAGEVIPQRAKPATVADTERAILKSQGLTSKRDDKGPRVILSATMTPDLVESCVQGVGGRVARLRTTDLLSYVPARCAALTGAQVLIVDGLSKDDVLLRARAMENRVSIVTADAGGLGAIVAPTGHVIWRRGGMYPQIDIGLGESDNKYVTPETHIWQQRRVASYSF